MPSPFSKLRKRKRLVPGPRMEREEEAAHMLPNTRFGIGAAALLVGGFLGSIFLTAIARGLPVVHPAVGNTDPLSLARPATQGAMSHFLKARNAQVLPGQSGWLFYDLGVQHVTGPGFLDPAVLKAAAAQGLYADPRPAMLDFRDQLKAQGIQLMIMPIPDKTSIYPEMLWPGYKHSQDTPQNSSYNAWKQDMRAADIPVYDPTELLLAAKSTSKDLLYVPTDSHWTPYAAQICGQGLAGWVKSCVTLGEPREASYRTYRTRARAPRDLVNLLGLPKDQTDYNPDPLPVRGIMGEHGYMPADHASDILIMGDSFCGVYDQAGANLSDQLAHELRQTVDCLSVSNGGSWNARFTLRDMIKKGEDRLAGKKLVIWEFTARDLSSGDWKPCDMGLGAKPAAMAPVAERK